MQSRLFVCLFVYGASFTKTVLAQIDGGHGVVGARDARYHRHYFEH